jgi:hypothetical protein
VKRSSSPGVAGVDVSACLHEDRHDRWCRHSHAAATPDCRLTWVGTGFEQVIDLPEVLGLERTRPREWPAAEPVRVGAGTEKPCTGPSDENRNADDREETSAGLSLGQSA